MADSDLYALRTADCTGRVLGELFQKHRTRLRRLVQLRLDRRVQGRLDPSDVLQEAYLEATGRVDEYVRDPGMPFFLWLRFLTAQKLHQAHRFHLGAQARDARKEISIDQGALGASSVVLAAHLLGRRTSPSQAAMRGEMKKQLETALDSMDPADREVIALRHFEQLTASETARVLGVAERTAGDRYLRAVRRLKRILGAAIESVPGLGDETRPSQAKGSP